MKKQTIINKINKRIKELKKQRSYYTTTGGAGKQNMSLRIIDLQEIKFDLRKLKWKNKQKL